MEKKEEKPYKVVASGDDVEFKVKPRGQTEQLCRNVLKDFIGSGQSKWHIEWVGKAQPVTVASYFRKLTASGEKGGEKGEFADDVKVHHSKKSKDFYFERVAEKPRGASR